VDEFMGYYNAIVGTSSYAVVYFREITGYTAKKKSATRWFSTNDVQELSLLPNTANGNLLRWADKMVEQGLCEKTAPKLRAFLLNPTKLKLFTLELTAVVMLGKGLKARNTALEGDTFEFITGYDTILHMGEAMKNPRSRRSWSRPSRSSPSPTAPPPPPSLPPPPPPPPSSLPPPPPPLPPPLLVTPVRS
jgi:hypothetical protein